jgi:hypothetical protein
MASTRPVETMDYLAAARRFIAAAGKRCAEADEHELSDLEALREAVEEAVTVAVIGWLERGHNLTDVARALGISRQAAHKRYAHVRPVTDPSD